MSDNINSRASSSLAGLLSQEQDRALLEKIVEAARQHLGMDVSFLAEFHADNKELIEVAGSPGPLGFDKGALIPLAETYCLRVVRGESSGIIPDTSEDPVVSGLPITKERQIGSYIGVPVQLPSGELFGTLCCVSREPTRDLSERDRKFMDALADLVASELHRELEAGKARNLKLGRIQSVIDAGGPRIAYQPIVNLETGEVVGVEALSRFPKGPATPDIWFSEAWEVGLGLELELAAVRKAFDLVTGITGELYVSVNVSPLTLQAAQFLSLLESTAGTRVVVEITEHAAIEEFGVIASSIERLRDRGARLAVDDLGAGYAGLSQALRLAPEILKLDNFLVAGIETDRPRQALAFAASSFATMTRGTLIAEGIETRQALETLKVLGVTYGQGYFLGRPTVEPEWQSFLEAPQLVLNDAASKD